LRVYDVCTTLELIASSKIIGQLPTQFPTTPLKTPKDIQLADLQCWAPGRVEMLIGAEIFYKRICPCQLRRNLIPPLLFQETVLGWVASGKINHFNVKGSKAASATSSCR